MGCNRFKSRNYKSALQYSNSVEQPILATNTLANPVVVDLGEVVTDTGCAFDFRERSYDIDYSGLYLFNNEFQIDGVTGGDVTIVMTLDGVPLAETTRVLTLVADIVKDISISTVRQVKTCFAETEHTIGLNIYSDGTAVGTINRVSGNVVKLA